MFGAVFCLNLDRRPDRWKRFQQGLPADWPFAQPERWAALDWSKTLVPQWFGAGAGAWGCLRSHVRIWRWQIEHEVESVLVFEDDAVFASNAVATMLETMALVPADWGQIYFGGQHLETDTMPPEVEIQDKLIRCRYTNRTHAYAIRLPFAAEAADYVDKPNNRDARLQHIDYLLADMHDSHSVFAPWRFCVGQAKGASDVKERRRQPAPVAEHWWNQFPIVDRPTVTTAMRVM